MSEIVVNFGSKVIERFEDDEHVYHTMDVKNRCLIIRKHPKSKYMAGSTVIHVFNKSQWTRAYNG